MNEDYEIETLSVVPEDLLELKVSGGHGLPLFLKIYQLGDRYSHLYLKELADFIENQKCIKIIRIQLDPEAEDNHNRAVDLIARAIQTRQKQGRLRVDLVSPQQPSHSLAAFLQKWPAMVSKLFQLSNQQHPINETHSFVCFRHSLCSLPNLQEIHTYNSEFTDRILSGFIQKGESQLKKIDIRGSIGREIGPYLSSSCSAKLRELSLGYIGLEEAEITLLTEGLLYNSSLIELKLSFNNSATHNHSGLPILVQFFRRVSSIRRLGLGGIGPGNLVLQDEELINALASNSCLEKMELENMFGHRDEGVSLRNFLGQNQTVNSLELFLEEESLNNGRFCRELAVGLENNTSIRKLRLACTTDIHRNVNLSNVFQSLTKRPQSTQLEELSMDIDEFTTASLLDLCKYLVHPNCRLETLKCEEATSSQGIEGLPYAALMDAVDCSPKLKRFDLSIRWYNNDLILRALELKSPTITQLKIEHESEEELNRDEIQRMKEQILESMTKNTSLEAVVLHLWSGWLDPADLDFAKQLNSICTRNKVIKMAQSLRQGGFPSSCLLPALRAIERDCQLLDESPRAYFYTAVFSFLTGRPADVPKCNHL